MTFLAKIGSLEFRRVFGSITDDIEHRSLAPHLFWRLAAHAGELTASGIFADCKCWIILSAEHKDDFEVFVPARQLARLAEVLSADVVVLEENGSNLIVRCGPSHFVLPFLGSGPRMVLDPPPRYVYDSYSLYTNIRLRRAVKVGSLADIQYGNFKGLRGVRFRHLPGAHLEIASTDLNTYSEATLTTERGASEQDWTSATRADLVEFALGVIGPPSEVVHIFASDGKLFIRSNGSCVEIPVLAEFQIPKTASDPPGVARAQIDRSALLGALDQVSAFVMNDMSVTFTFERRELVISGGQRELGEAIVVFPLKSIADSSPFQIRRTVLHDWLRAVDTDNVVVSWSKQSMERVWWRSESPQMSCRLVVSTLAS
jgi:DNA polymerase III sliding clamp (beta) subunit (PCNA family)